MNYDIIVIGAGIVGLSTALKIKERKPAVKLMVIDKEKSIAMHQTGNNSGVIHSGLYYKPGSLKAKNCIRGYNLLLNFCEQNNINFDICGKVVIATETGQLPVLETLYERGSRNGLEGLKILSKDSLGDYEPHVNGIKGIFVPQTGIIDFAEVAKKMASFLFDYDSEIRLNEKVTKIVKQKNFNLVLTDKSSYSTKIIVNCAGLYSDKIAKMTGEKIDFQIIPFRGEYYELKKDKNHLIKNLIYPVPDPNFPFLGVHFTRMINGGVEAGPNAVLAFAREGYKKTDIRPLELLETLLWPGFHKIMANYWKTGFEEMYRSFSKKAFVKALQELVPEITEEDLESGGSGVRAQACYRNGNLIDDFLIIENDISVNVCNAPSPAATSSLAIGEAIAKTVLKRLKSISFKF